MVLAEKAFIFECLFCLYLTHGIVPYIPTLKRALNWVRFLFAYKSNNRHRKKYFHFFS